MTPDIYQISIDDCDISQQYAALSRNSFERFGYGIIPWKAITPNDVGPIFPFKFGEIRSRSTRGKFTSTEIAVWYSHASLWKHCISIDKPIIVIEHDCVLHKHLPDFSAVAWMPFAQRSMLPAALVNLHLRRKSIVWVANAYYITPWQANRFYQQAMEEVISLNVDGFMARYTIEAKSRPYVCASHYFTPELGNTIDHRR